MRFVTAGIPAFFLSGLDAANHRAGPRSRLRQALVCADANTAECGESSEALETARVTGNPEVLDSAAVFVGVLGRGVRFP